MAGSVNRVTIRPHLEKHGHLDLMAGTEAANCDAMPYWIGGRIYPSQSAIARIIDIDRKVVRSWIMEGKTDRLANALREARA